MEKIIHKNKARAKKMMLWFGMISMTMTFAGLTSAYVVSSSRADWLKSFELPEVFLYSTVLILLSSVSFFLGRKSLDQGKITVLKMFLWITLGLTSGFIYFQFTGFSEIIAQGYYFTGAASSITTSFIYVLVLLHLTHVFAGLIVLLIVIFQSFFNSFYL